MSNFPERLKECRVKAGMTQKVLANHLGISERAYQHYEYGQREPNYAILASLSTLFGVSAEYLLGSKDDEKINVALNSVPNVQQDHNSYNNTAKVKIYRCGDESYVNQYLNLGWVLLFCGNDNGQIIYVMGWPNNKGEPNDPAGEHWEKIGELGRRG